MPLAKQQHCHHQTLSQHCLFKAKRMGQTDLLHLGADSCWLKGQGKVGGGNGSEGTEPALAKEEKGGQH